MVAAKSCVNVLFEPEYREVPRPWFPKAAIRAQGLRMSCAPDKGVTTAAPGLRAVALTASIRGGMVRSRVLFAVFLRALFRMTSDVSFLVLGDQKAL